VECDVEACRENVGFMIVQCAPACQTCEKISFAKRCPVNATLPMVLNGPGDLNRIFERITTNPDYQEHFGPMTIHSSPASTGGPWIVTFDNFVSSEECQRLIDIGQEEGYTRSAE
jgi:prolyl 4-hydroxylase